MMVEFWKIVNIHIPYADVRMRHPLRTVIRSPNDINLQKLLDIGNMAEQTCSPGKRYIKRIISYLQRTGRVV